MKDKIIHCFAAFGLLSLTAAVFLAIGLTVPPLPGLQSIESQESSNESVPAEAETSSTDSAPTNTTDFRASSTSATTFATRSTTACSSTTTTKAETTKIPINTATKAELMSISGIGQSFAARIITYREEHGGFKSIEELKNIEGVGEKRYAAWAPYFSIDG